MIRYLVLAVFAVLAAAPARADDPMRMAVYDLIAARLALMQPVAAWKHARGDPVEDLEREDLVIQTSILEAHRAGLDPETVRSLFEAQVAAAKAIQHCWIARCRPARPWRPPIRRTWRPTSGPG